MLALLAWLGFAQAGVLSFVDKGVQIDCGSMGAFVLGYPVLETTAGKLAPSEKKLGEEAVLNYPSGISLKISVTGDKKIVLKFSGDTGGIKTFRMADLLIPMHFSEGGEWKIGDGEKKAFPKEKPAKPHLYQGSVGRFEFSSPEGGGDPVQPSSVFIPATSRQSGMEVGHLRLALPNAVYRRHLDL